MENRIKLKKFDKNAHYELLKQWVYKPHIAKWWGSPEKNLKDILNLEIGFLGQALIIYDEKEVGFICWQKPSREELDEAGLFDVSDDLILYFLLLLLFK